MGQHAPSMIHTFYLLINKQGSLVDLTQHVLANASESQLHEPLHDYNAAESNRRLYNTSWQHA